MSQVVVAIEDAVDIRVLRHKLPERFSSERYGRRCSLQDLQGGIVSTRLLQGGAEAFRAFHGARMQLRAYTGGLLATALKQMAHHPPCGLVLRKPHAMQ